MRKLKNILFLHFMAAFHNSALKIEISSVKMVLMPFSETEMQIMLVRMFVLFIHT